MSEFQVEIVRIDSVVKHPNADNLDICTIYSGYPVVTRRGQFREGDTAVYFPIDSILPTSGGFAFLEGKRLRAKRLRGELSMGLLWPNEAGFALGRNVQDLYQVTRWEPKPQTQQLPKIRGLSVSDGQDSTAPKCAQREAYDLESWRKYKREFCERQAGKEVVVTEKIHGQNFRAVYTEGRLFIGSRNRWLRPDAHNAWAVVAKRYDLENRLRRIPDVVFYGEIYGNNADMAYNVKRGETGDELRIFDIYDCQHHRFQRWGWLEILLADVGLSPVPVLYQGPLAGCDVEALAEGPTTINGASHVREGVVIQSLSGNRDILKHHGIGYLTRKGA